MKQSLRVLVCALGMVLVSVAAASAAPDRTIEMTPGTLKTWAGTDAPGANVAYWGDPVTGSNATRACGKNVQDYCDYVLLAFTNPVPDTDADGRVTRSATITVDANNDVSDFDLVAYASDAAGTRGTELVRDARFIYAATTETVTVSVQTTRTQPTVYVLAEIVYFTAAQGYAGSVSF